MTPESFAQLLNNFAGRPLPPLEGRHVYLWHGEESALRLLLRPGLEILLDLYALTMRLERTPGETDEARRLLQTAVSDWLRAQSPSPGSQKVIIVTGGSLLARYRVSLDNFFQVSSESRLVIFVVSSRETRFQSSKPLPAFVTLQPTATFAYLQTAVGANATIGVSPQ